MTNGLVFWIVVQKNSKSKRYRHATQGHRIEKVPFLGCRL